MTEELKPLPCPFCGAMPAILAAPETGWEVRCTNLCGCNVQPNSQAPMQRLAVQLWNTRFPAWRDEGPVFIQWKGTDVCCDLHCPDCGEHSHFDGMFAYHLKCGGCGSVWKMPTHVGVEAADRAAKPILFSIDEGPLQPPEER